MKRSIVKFIQFCLIISWLWTLRLALPALAQRPQTTDRRPPTTDQRQSAVGGLRSAVVLTGTLPFTTEIRSSGYIKGLYITYYGLGWEPHRTRPQELLETTELNAIVMDVKGDFGWLPYTSTVQMALDIGAGNRPMINDWVAWMQWFKERHIYTIARIVLFKDEPLATAHPEWAVIDSATGGIWRDRENLGWVDPTREEVWDYNIALA